MADQRPISIEDAALEEWRVVAGWGGLYSISSAGRLRGKGGHLLRVQAPVQGRLHVSLEFEGRRRGTYLHTLVLETFVGPRPDGTEASHLNGIAWDNRLENLCWETHRENMARKYDHGTVLAGGRAPGAILSDEDARFIFTNYVAHDPELGNRGFAKRFGICAANVRLIIKRKTFTKVTADLPDPDANASDRRKRELAAHRAMGPTGAVLRRILAKQARERC